MGSGTLFRVIAAVAVLGVLAAGYWWLARPHPRVTSLISRSGVHAVRSAHHVRAVRLIDEDPAREGGPQRRVPGPILTSEQQAELRGLILDDRHYLWHDAKACIFHPDVDLVFEDEHGTPLLTVTLCFTCLEWAFSTGDSEDFDPVAPRLRALANTLFPEHPVRTP